MLEGNDDDNLANRDKLYQDIMNNSVLDEKDRSDLLNEYDANL